MTNELHKQFDNQNTIAKVLIDDVTDYATLIVTGKQIGRAHV